MLPFEEPHGQELDVQLILILVFAHFLDDTALAVQVLQDHRAFLRVIGLPVLFEGLHSSHELLLDLVFHLGRVGQLNQIPLYRNIQLLDILNPEPFSLVSLGLPLVMHYRIVLLEVFKAQQVLVLFPAFALLKL